MIVKVSARLLAFPNLCCCCGTTGATEKYSATATRTTGKRVIKTTDNTWNFPICEKCLAWIVATREASARKSLFIFSMLLALVSLLYSINQTGSSALAYSILAVLVTIAGGSLELLRRQNKLCSEIRPPNSCSAVPVHYLGWQGSVHTFDFSNVEFSNRFMVANSKKLVG